MKKLTLVLVLLTLIGCNPPTRETPVCMETLHKTFPDGSIELGKECNQ